MFFVFACDDDSAAGGADDCELIADTLEDAMQWTPAEHWDTVGIYTVQDRQFVQVAEGEISTEYGAIIPEPVRGDPQYVWLPHFGTRQPRSEETYHVTWTALPKERSKPRVVQRPNSQSASVFAHRPVPQIPGPPLVTGFGADDGSVTMTWTLSPTVEASAESRPTVQEQIVELRGITRDTKYYYWPSGPVYLSHPRTLDVDQKYFGDAAHWMETTDQANEAIQHAAVAGDVAGQTFREAVQRAISITARPRPAAEAQARLLGLLPPDEQPTTITCPTCGTTLDERDRRVDGRIKCWRGCPAGEE